MPKEFRLSHRVVPREEVCSDDVALRARLPRRRLLVLHGVFGSGSNWQTFAKRLTRALPKWQAVLVDLREHGRSQGASPPHDLDACAGDLMTLNRKLESPVDAVCGHSFGGKLALLFGAACAAEGKPLRYVAVLDADPAARMRPRDNERRQDSLHMLDLLEGLPRQYPARADFTAALRTRGVSAAVASWLGMNLRYREGSYSLRMEIPALRALVLAYHMRDLWVETERVAAATPIRFVFGGRSSVMSAELLERIEEAARNSAHPIRTHVLPNAGHWLHVDALEGLLQVVRSDLDEIAAEGT